MAFYDFALIGDGPVPASLNKESGDWHISFSKLTFTGTTLVEEPYWVINQESNADGAVMATFSLNNGGGGLNVRCSDVDNMIILAHNENVGGDGGTFEIIQREAGVNTTLAKAIDLGGHSPVVTYTYAATMSGNNIDFWCNGVRRLTVQTSFNNTATKHGARIKNTGATAIHTMFIEEPVTNPYAIAAIGQSNISGRGTSNQVYVEGVSSAASLFSNNYVYQTLADPYDASTPQVDIVSADAAGGSWIPEFASSWTANISQDLTMVPCAKGGTTIAMWQKDSTDRVDGLNLYESFLKRVGFINGIDMVFFQLGESDAQDTYGTLKSDYKAGLLQLATDIYQDTGSHLFIIPLHTITQAGFNGDGITTGQVPIREAQVELAAENKRIHIGSPLTAIDISDGDGLHFKEAADLTAVSNQVYTDFSTYLAIPSTSSLDISIANMPSGTFSVVLTETDGEAIFSGDVVFTEGAATVVLNVAPSTVIQGFVTDNSTPSVKAAYIESTTYV